MKYSYKQILTVSVFCLGTISCFGASWSYPTSTPSTPFASGSGTSSSPYMIYTAQQLANMAYLINTNSSTYGSKYYKLGNNIDLESALWTPINGFWGTFDGANKVISGLYASEDGNQGLFAENDSGTIKYLGVSGTSRSSSYCGGIVAKNYGTISHCYSAVTVSGFREDEDGDNTCEAGGICSVNGGTVEYCYNTGSVRGYDSDTYCQGGIVCSNTGTIRNCYNIGNIYYIDTDSKSSTSGLICAVADEGSIISNCYGQEQYYSGTKYYLKIVGWNRASNTDITNCETKTAAQFKSGEVCYLLNGSTQGGTHFYQNIGTHDAPVLWGTSSKVYVSGSVYCCRYGRKVSNSYSNTSTSSTTTSYANSFTQYSAVSPTCTSSGRIAYWKCKTCGTMYSNSTGTTTVTAEDITIPALGHDYQYSEYDDEQHLKKCSRCSTQSYEAHTMSGNVCIYCGYSSTASGAWSYPTNTPTSPFASGTGTLSDPYKISTTQQLANFAYLVNKLNSTYGNKYYEISRDLDMNASGTKSWVPISNFSGTLDGSQHTITGLYYSGSSNAGLFASNKGTIKNLGIVSSTITTYAYAASIAAENEGTISHCYNTSSITSNKSYAGGICTVNKGCVEYCYNTGSIKGGSEDSDTSVYTGGIVCRNYGTIASCYNTGNIYYWESLSDSGNGSDCCSGLICCLADNGSVISDCYSLVQYYSQTKYYLNPIGWDCSQNTAGVTTAITNCSTKTESQFKSGEVCFLLNRSVQGGTDYYQTINTNDYPLLWGSSSKVYYSGSYTNTQPNFVTSISLSQTSATLTVGRTLSLSATVSPSTATNKSITWSSNNTSVATVNQSGIVQAISAGTAIVKALAQDGSGVYATCTVTVIEDLRPTVVTSNTAGATVTFSNSNTYEWEWDSTNSRLRSTNYQIASSTSQTTITIVATKSTTLAFNYAVSSQSNYDKYTITLDGSTIVNAISGVSNSSYSGTVSAGTHTLVLSYSKNASTNSYQDRAYFSNLKLTHSHSYSNGICSGCGEYEAPTLSGSYYLIDNAGKLYWFAQKVNAGSTSICGKLTDNITVNSNVLTSAGELNGTPSMTWTPIGNASKPYAGTFEGQNYSISGLYTNTSSTSLIGFFGDASGATIQNLCIKDSYFCGNEHVAGICGSANNARFAKCSNYSKIKGTNYVGGIVGDTEGGCSIDNCCNYGKISGTNNIGGIVGDDFDDGISSRRIYLCINQGVISGSSCVGGIIGKSCKYAIRDCANYATITGSGSWIGGICGYTSEVSYSTTSYTYYEYSTIANCLNVSSVTGSTSGSIVGSLHSGTTITNCYFDSSKKSNAFGSGTATGATGRTSFSTGAVTYLLNGSKSATDECNWYQNIDNGSSDAYPIPDDTHGDVYALPQLDYYTNSVIVPASSVTVASQEIAVGQSLTMTATVLPTNATVNTQAFKNKYIEPIDWSGGTSGIATIDSETGDVTTVGNGTVTFTAKVLDGSNKTGSATVRAYLLGDANGNDKVNVADVTTIAAKLNGLTPANYHFAPANANFTDAVINSADITTTLGIAWNGVSYTAPARHAADRDNEPTRLYAIPLTAMAGNEAVLSIVVDNPSETFSAFDFVIELPEGLSVKKSADGTLIAQVSTERTDADKTDYFSATQREDGTVYVLCYSTMLDQFEGQTGTVATITLELDRNLECGDYEIALRDIVLSGYGEVISCDDNKSTVSVVTPDGIEGVNDEAAPGWVYDLNGRLVKIDGQPVRSLDNLPEGIYVINGQKVSK